MKKTNMVRRATITAVFLMLIATLGSCVKGDKGDPGPAGTSGTNGTNGTNGVANINSWTVTVHSNGWTNAGNGLYTNNCLLDSITANVINSGTVQVFLQNGTGVWVGMPTTIYSSSTVSIYYGFEITAGDIEFFLQNSAGGTISFSSDIIYKVVIIPSALRKANPTVNWNDYSQIQAALGNSMIETNLQTK